MNRLFNRGRNYKMLSLLMAIVMLFSLLPSSIVNAEAQIVATATTLVAESGNGFANDETTAGKVVYDPAGATLGKLRARVEFPADYVPALGDEVTINYETNIPSLSAEFGYDYNSSNARTMTSEQTSITFSLDENDLAYFADNTTGYEAAIRFKQSSCPEGSYLAVSSVTVTRDVNAGNGETGNESEDGDNGGNTGGTEGGEQPPAGEVSAPTMTLGWFGEGFKDVSSQYPDDFFATSYTTTTSWEAVVYNVANHDSSVYSQLEVTLTTSRDGMEFCVSDQTWGAIFPWTSLSAGTHTITIDFTRDASVLNFYFDSGATNYVSDTEITAVVHSVKFINPNASGTPEAPVTPEEPTEIPASKANFTSFDNSTGITVDSYSAGGIGTFSYTEGATARLYANFSGYTYQAGDVLVVMSEALKTANMEQVLIGYSTSSGNYIDLDRAGTVNDNMVVYTLPEATFTDGTEPTLIRWKGVFPGTTASFDGIYIWSAETYAAYCETLEKEEEPSGAAPGVWGVEGGPTVTLDMNSDGFTCVANEDGSVTVSYPSNIGWKKLKFAVENSDITKYSSLQIDFTPSWDGMNLGVYHGNDAEIVSAWGPGVVSSAERQTRKIDLKTDLTEFYFYIDMDASASPLPTESTVSFTIHSIKIVDPTVPEGEVLDAPLSVESGAFAMDGTDTIRANDGGKLRARITLPKDFRVEEGKQLTFYYDTNIEGLDVDFTWDWTDSSLANSTFKVDKNAQAFTIDQSWVDYINNNATGTNPTVRLKLDSAPAGSYFTLKYVVYGDVSGNQYNPEQVPQGLVVTYYNDIYSRGVAWNTDNTVEENALYYVKAMDGMTAENVDWTSSDVQKIEAISKDTTDTTGKTWRTFKAHVENLDAGAKYFYRAGNEETGWSEVGSFTIEKAKEEITGLSFIHVTDSQEESQAGFQKWARVLKEAYTKDPNAAFVAHTGDIVNRSENKNNFYMSEWIYVFDEPMSQIMNGVFVPASGNHETLDYVFTDRFDIQWADYKEGDEELRYGGCYTVTYGEPENGLVMINLNNTAEAWNYDTDFKLYQQVWLVEQLEKYSDYKWKVVQLHEGLMTAGDHTNDGEVDTMRDALPPIFAKYKVDLVLQGHDHVYTRTRSYAYGENVFEPGTEENPNYFNGHTPVWTETQTLEPGETSADGSVTNNLDRTIYLEPQGTHYITINSCGTKQYPEEPADRIDEVIFEGDNPIHPTDENGNYGSMCQPGLPMYGIVSIEGDLLIYDSYTYDHNTRTSDLYDSFAVSKANKSGYNTDNPHEGKEEVQLYGIKMESKTYDGYAPKLDVSGFVASDPRVMDVTSLVYTITSADDDGASYYQSAKGELFYGSNGKGIIPTQRGEYVLTVEIPQSNRYFWGSITVRFSID